MITLRAPVIASLALMLVGCGGGGNSGSAPPIPPTGSNVRDVTADLSRYITDSVRYVQAFSEGYVVPSAAQLNQFDSVVASLVGQDVNTAAASAGASLMPSPTITTAWSPAPVAAVMYSSFSSGCLPP